MKLWVPNPASVEFSGSIPTNSRPLCTSFLCDGLSEIPGMPAWSIGEARSGQNRRSSSFALNITADGLTLPTEPESIWQAKIPASQCFTCDAR
ncbi:hypothetical protein Y1Q_0006142 [Alligator mississippiensis]|uniref:Uncharacterized protein n=1 Tax=Alligator mississippiensis TaxID=8496 RepID=A0A151NWN4_ALLMI|nr:hypothetical protein Y1Q_0006142 [Alligator mississippiensis]